MPSVTNNIYTAAYNAISATCTLRGFKTRAEFVSRDGDEAPDKFVLYRLQAEEGVRAADNELPSIRYVVEFTVALPDSEANRADIYKEHWVIRSALVAAGFIPQGDYDLGIDKTLGIVYVSKTYYYYMKVSDIS